MKQEKKYCRYCGMEIGKSWRKCPFCRKVQDEKEGNSTYPKNNMFSITTIKRGLWRFFKKKDPAWFEYTVCQNPDLEECIVFNNTSSDIKKASAEFAMQMDVKKKKSNKVRIFLPVGTGRTDVITAAQAIKLFTKKNPSVKVEILVQDKNTVKYIEELDELDQYLLKGQCVSTERQEVGYYEYDNSWTNNWTPTSPPDWLNFYNNHLTYEFDAVEETVLLEEYDSEGETDDAEYESDAVEENALPEEYDSEGETDDAVEENVLPEEYDSEGKTDDAEEDSATEECDKTEPNAIDSDFAAGGTTVLANNAGKTWRKDLGGFISTPSSSATGYGEGLIFPVYAPTSGGTIDTKLDELIRNKSKNSFVQKLYYYIDKKGMSDVETYKAAHLDKRTFSKLRSKADKYRPSKQTAIAFALGLHLDIKETSDLLASAQLMLSDASDSDIIVSYCISKNIYDMFTINEYLEHYNQPLFPMYN